MIRYFIKVVLFHLIYIHHGYSCILCKSSSSLSYISLKLPLLTSSTLKGDLIIYNKYNKYIPLLNSKKYDNGNDDDRYESSSLPSLSSILSYFSRDLYENQRRSIIKFGINKNNQNSVIYDNNIFPIDINNNYQMNDARNDNDDKNYDHIDRNSDDGNDNNNENTNNNNNLTNNYIQQFMLNSILWYKSTLSPILPPRCRFLPTCSSYGIESIEKYGPWKGGILTIWRIFRCNPLGGSGYDPPIWPPPDYFTGTTSSRRRRR